MVAERPLYLEYFERLRRLDRPGALALVEDYLATSGDVLGVYSEILMPALRHTGDEWAADRLSVAHEHYISEVTRELIRGLGPRLWVEAGHPGPVAVAGCVPGERHVLGLMMICDAMRTAGVTVHLLGEGAPAEAICDFVVECGADWVCLSCTLEDHLPEVADLVAMLRAARPQARVLVGGAAFRAKEGPPPPLHGADHFAPDLRALQQLLPTLLEGGAGTPG